MNDLAKKNRAFTLAEVLATLVISAMIMIAVLGIYSSVKRSAAAIDRRLERFGLPSEILQRIAEDIDRMVMTVTDTKITFKNRMADGIYSGGQLIIESTIYGTNNRPQTFEKIIWQSRSDADANGLILYRAHSGFAMEDYMLDEPKEKYQRELFVPICQGLTHFSIGAVQGKILLDKWTEQLPPRALEISLSFTEPVENLLGNYEVPEENIITRTIAVDRIRKIAYKFVKQEFVLPIYEDSEPNEMETEPSEGETEPNELLRKPDDTDSILPPRRQR